MNKRELLNTYRETVLVLGELESQLARTGTDGRPAGCRGIAPDNRHAATNMPDAAMRQLADGLEDLAQRKRDELAQMSGDIYNVLGGIRDGRTFTVVQRYYLMGETDSDIGRMMSISRSRVNQIRMQFLGCA